MFLGICHSRLQNLALQQASSSVYAACLHIDRVVILCRTLCMYPAPATFVDDVVQVCAATWNAA